MTRHRHRASTKRKLKPSSTKERLEVKIDKLIEEQVAERETNKSQFQAMMAMFEKQHKERMLMMSGLMKAIGSKGKKSKTSAHSDSDDSS